MFLIYPLMNLLALTCIFSLCLFLFCLKAGFGIIVFGFRFIGLVTSICEASRAQKDGLKIK